MLLINKPKFINKLVYVRIELDLNSDSIVAGANSCIMQCTNMQFYFSSYCDNEKLVRNAPIAQSKTKYK